MRMGRLEVSLSAGIYVFFERIALLTLSNQRSN